MASEVTNYSNIPDAPFSEEVTGLMQAGEKPEQTLSSFNTLLQKYRIMESSLANKRDRFVGLKMEIESSIDAIRAIQTSPEENTQFTFELGDTLYAKASIPSKSAVGLWLGAGVMLEYEGGEAIEFLEVKLKERVEEIGKVVIDLEFIRRQITTMEVNIARLYNYLVQLKKSSQ